MTTKSKDPETRTTLAPLEPGVRVPDTVPELLEATRPATRRPWIWAAALGMALIVVATAIVLAVVRPFEDTSGLRYTPGDWDGDWKDLVIENADVESDYSGDWKDLIAQ